MNIFHDSIIRRDTVRGDKQQRGVIGELVDIADFALGDEREGAVEGGGDEGGHCCVVLFDGGEFMREIKSHHLIHCPCPYNPHHLPRDALTR